LLLTFELSFKLKIESFVLFLKSNKSALEINPEITARSYVALERHINIKLITKQLLKKDEKKINKK